MFFKKLAQAIDNSRTLQRTAAGGVFTAAAVTFFGSIALGTQAKKTESSVAHANAASTQQRTP